MRAVLIVIMTMFFVFELASIACADDAKTLAEKAVKAAGGADKLPKIIRWEEIYFLSVFGRQQASSRGR